MGGFWRVATLGERSNRNLLALMWSGSEARLDRRLRFEIAHPRLMVLNPARVLKRASESASRICAGQRGSGFECE